MQVCVVLDVTFARREMSVVECIIVSTFVISSMNSTKIIGIDGDANSRSITSTT